MRIVLVTGIFPPDIGGPATHAAAMQEELSGRGHDVTIVSLTDASDVTRSAELVLFPRRWSWPFRMAAVTWWLLRNRRRFDVIYAVGLHPAAAVAGWIGRRPVVSRVVADPAWERGSRIGLTDEGFESFQSAPGRGARMTAMRWLRDRSLSGSKLVIVPTDGLAQHVLRWGATRERVRVVPNAARSLAHPVRAESNGRLRAVFAGRLIPLKRVDVVIDALALTPHAVLTVVGDGPERSRLEERAERSGVGSRVSFLGALPHEETLERIAAADVLVMPSSYDTSPNAVVEALVGGTPVIGSSAGGLPELIGDGRGGVLLDPVTPKAIAETLDRLQVDRAALGALAKEALAAGSLRSITGAADAIEGILVEAAGKPHVVIVGTARMKRPLQPDVVARFRALESRLDATVVAMGDAGIRREGNVRLVVFPDIRPRALAMLLFYGSSPLLALPTRRGRSTLLCQGPHVAFGPLLLSRLLPSRSRPRILIELHGDPRASSRLYGGRARKTLAPLSDRIARWVVKRADLIRSVGPHTETLARAAGYTGEIETFVTFSDLGPFVERPITPPSEAKTVLYAGAFEPTKGVDTLLDAWAIVERSHPDASLVLAGDGALRASSEKRSERFDRPGAVTFAGHVRTEALVDLLDHASVLVLPSRSEGTPRIILEAMARGRPVVATAVGGIPDLVDDGITGSLVRAEDPDALAAALEGILSDPERAAAMGAKGAERFAERDPRAEYDAGLARIARWVARDG